jgi:predicted RNA binding protein YcfA (HicA-like mRNA interferase family)
MKKYLIVKKLKKAGFTELHGGKHDVFKKDGFPPIIVGRHNDIPERTAKAILKTAGIK